MLGNIMQQLYNLADTWIVGRYIGDNALAAVGSSYTLITFLTSVIIGLSLGKGLCYIGIGILFMLYGYYRAVNKPLMSVVLTILSLGTIVLLAYILSPYLHSELWEYGLLYLSTDLLPMQSEQDII
jgi:Na+-driven multidrug efflux pump